MSYLFPLPLGPELMKIVKPLWDDPDQPDAVKLSNLWQTLTGFQSFVLAQMLYEKLGDHVAAGPFQGMKLSMGSMRGTFAPFLLGTYEWELHKAIETALTKPYAQIINIGCSFGYYSTGFARRMPFARVHAYDIDTDACQKCLEMAALNDVAGRVSVSGEFFGDDFARFAGPETLLIMDIEGAEMALLDPTLYPALKHMDIIVELHDCANPLISASIPARFADTHEIEIVHNTPVAVNLKELLGGSYEPGYFDALLATWEGRGGPTPWAIMTRKKAA